jgi:outer membrane protein OmpA-like peptidoglycan-associated protein
MVAGILIAYPGLNIAIGGYTDNVGTDQLNQGLSEEVAGLCATTSCNKVYRRIR